MVEILFYSGVSVALTTALLKIIEKVVMIIICRRAKNKDKVMENKCNFESVTTAEIKNLEIAIRALLHDRIKYLCRTFKKANKISFGDRQDLITMHDIYHSALGGNGNLDSEINDIMQLDLSDEVI